MTNDGATECNETRSTDLDGPRARALELLLAGDTPAAVARELGVDRTTLWRWRTSSSFARRYREAMGERAADAAVRLDAAAGKALDLLESVIDDEAHPMIVRLRAADSVLRHAALTRPQPSADAQMTDEDRISRLVEALQSEDPTLAEALRRVGLNPESIVK